MENLSILINSIRKSHFADLYYVVDEQSHEVASILFVSCSEALSHAKYLELKYARHYNVCRNCVYLG